MPRAAEAETDFDFGTRTPQSREADVPAAAVPEQFGERYRVEALLGRGGMAAVYRAQDRTSGRVLAIKHSSRRPDTREGRELCALFEREFHLLAQLSHPRVIEVYDFGLQDGRPYYTMELLDGGDPSELTPLPWRRACAVMHDVCSSLALLHSRRFVHRDVSPLNVRCTRDGFAKLIDFGAAAVDGRRAADRGHAGVPAARSLEPFLFALGATCYFALTGELAYHARELAQLGQAWSHTSYAPSALVPDIPPALDELVMALINLEAAQRPRSAYEVMQRLAVIADLPRSESEAVPQAYLSAPITVGRGAELERLRLQLSAAVQRMGSATLLAAPSGAGHTHMLDACALAGNTLGATVLRAGADPSGLPFRGRAERAHAAARARRHQHLGAGRARGRRRSIVRGAGAARPAPDAQAGRDAHGHRALVVGGQRGHAAAARGRRRA